MITIYVDHKPLHIPADTAIIYEQNNNLLGEDGICADIVWSFEIPAEPNQRILGTVQYTYSSGNRRYECEIAVDGIPISRGELYIQSTMNEKRLTCGIVANAFGVGFGDRMLRENDYGADVVISETESGHQEAWRQFLLGSISSNIYRFFLFYDSKFYKDNDDYGYFLDKKSPLVEDDNEGLANGYVNRLFWQTQLGYNSAGRPIGLVTNLIEDATSSKRGCRLFNVRKVNGKQNGYCFAPALRLDWLVRKVIENATLAASGTFFDSAEIQKLYTQSMCAMDGNALQYGGRNWLVVKNTYNPTSEETGTQSFVSSESGEVANVTGFYGALGFNFSLNLDQSTLARNGSYSGEENFELEDEIFAIAVMPKDGGTLPTWRMKAQQYGGNENDYDPFIYGHLKSISELKQSMYLDSDDTISSVYEVSNGCAKFNYTHHGLVFSWNRTSNDIPLNHSDSILVQITPSRSRPKNNLSEGYIRGELSMFGDAANVTCCHYNWNYILRSGRYVIRLVKLKVATSKSTIRVRWKNCNYLMNVHLSAYGQMEKLTYCDELSVVPIALSDPTLNIFSRLLEWKKHVPNLSNGEFLNTICQAFGLSLFTNPMTRQLQLNFFTDTLKGSFFDISEWTTSKERMEFTPKKYEITMSPLLGSNDVSGDNILPDVRTRSNTPSALMNIGKHLFVENEAAYRGSEVDEEKGEFTWPQEAGDSRPLIAGASSADATEKMSIDINIPNMTDPDEFSGVSVAEKYICQVEQEGCSPMLDKEYTGEFPLVLMQDRGDGVLSGGLDGIRYAAANPTRYNANGSISSSAMGISTAGESSIGEKWLRPVYDLLGNCDRFRLTAHLPSWAYFKVLATMQPQDGTPAQQVRYIQCGSLRILPVKISSELSGRANIVCTIEGITPHFDF